jgi:membrane protein involved in colicin uptake
MQVEPSDPKYKLEKENKSLHHYGSAAKVMIAASPPEEERVAVKSDATGKNDNEASSAEPTEEDLSGSKKEADEDDLDDFFDSLT